MAVLSLKSFAAFNNTFTSSTFSIRNGFWQMPTMELVSYRHKPVAKTHRFAGFKFFDILLKKPLKVNV